MTYLCRRCLCFLRRCRPNHTPLSRVKRYYFHPDQRQQRINSRNPSIPSSQRLLFLSTPRPPSEERVRSLEAKRREDFKKTRDARERRRTMECAKNEGGSDCRCCIAAPLSLPPSRSLCFRNNVSPPGCLTIHSLPLSLCAMPSSGTHSHKFRGGVRGNCKGAGKSGKRERRLGRRVVCLPNSAASRRNLGRDSRDVSFGQIENACRLWRSVALRSSKVVHFLDRL